MNREEALKILINGESEPCYKNCDEDCGHVMICLSHKCKWAEAMDVIREALKDRPHGECKTCKHFVKGGLDGKTYVCEHPDIVLDDHFDYACIEMNEDDFCSRYVPREGDPDDRA